MHIQQVAGALGAEISDIDLSQGLSAAQAQDVRAAFPLVASEAAALARLKTLD